jgi:hypothetical protein
VPQPVAPLSTVRAVRVLARPPLVLAAAITLVVRPIPAPAPASTARPAA